VKSNPALTESNPALKESLPALAVYNFAPDGEIGKTARVNRKKYPKWKFGRLDVNKTRGAQRSVNNEVCASTCRRYDDASASCERSLAGHQLFTV
jgi:hypothetical protein